MRGDLHFLILSTAILIPMTAGNILTETNDPTLNQTALHHQTAEPQSLSGRLGKITREEMHNFFRGFGHPEAGTPGVWWRSAWDLWWYVARTPNMQALDQSRSIRTCVGG